MLTATVTVPRDDRLLSLFAAEDKTTARASYTVEATADSILFSVQANDATALRSCLTTITKVLSVWESTLQYEH